MPSPDITTFKTRFPEFASVPDATLTAVIDEAVAEVGESWTLPDRYTAQFYLAAHLLASQGYGAGSASGSAMVGTMKRRKVGDVEVEFAGAVGTSSGAGISDYKSTPYGVQYLRLKRRNFPSVMVV